MLYVDIYVMFCLNNSLKCKDTQYTLYFEKHPIILFVKLEAADI